MEMQNRDAEFGTPRFESPSLPPKPGFSASGKEIGLAFAIYAAAYLYVIGTSDTFFVFCGLFIALVEWRNWGRPRSAESWVWLGCLVCIISSRLLGRDQVWGEWFELLSHAFAIYWTLSRSGVLLGGESSTLLPLDALHGCVVFPFKHFFLRVRTLLYAATRARDPKAKRPTSARIFSVLAVLAAVLLFGRALLDLRAADAQFSKLSGQLLDVLNWEAFRLDVDVLFRILLSLPVGAYLFGLICGTCREERHSLDERTVKIRERLALLRQVSAKLWIALLAAFAALYCSFFVIRAADLFGAFSRTLPEGLTVAEYARQGFFSLCRVMGVNFALLWLATRTRSNSAAPGAAVKWLSALLLVQSLLFAVIAASKLYLYIDCFGFTPKRLQSAWLILSLSVGCGTALYSLLSGKKSFRLWLLFSGVSLALLHLY